MSTESTPQKKEKREKRGWFENMHSWYARFERPLSSISLVGGFVFDALTLKRVDLFWENFWVVIHLAVVAIAIILINRQEVQGTVDGIDKKDPSKFHFWLRNILQFAFGGLLSTFLVFYFRSGALSVSWPFLLLLAIAFIANETFKHHFSRMAFQISFFYLSLFSFAIFLVPVLLGRIGLGIFILSGLVSLVAIWIFLIILRVFSGERFKKSKIFVEMAIFGIFAVTNLLYFFNFIPPIPLSLKDAGVYYSITRTADGDYSAQTDVQSDPGGVEGFLSNILNFFHPDPTIYVTADLSEPLYVYSAVFSPATFSTSVFHVWQYYDEATQAWVTTDKISLPVNGGRDGGYRTYSLKTSGIMPGKWRVNVETDTGQVIGRLNFTIAISDTLPAMVDEVKS